jgi:hypothetical protein
VAIEHWTNAIEGASPPQGRHLHLVAPAYSVGAPVEERRARRAQRATRRRRGVLAAGVLITLVILVWPGHAFGGVTASGVPVDQANSSLLAPGTSYVVRSGDTVTSIASMVNPFTPSIARAAIINELHTSAIVPGERIVIP